MAKAEEQPKATLKAKEKMKMKRVDSGPPLLLIAALVALVACAATGIVAFVAISRRLTAIENDSVFTVTSQVDSQQTLQNETGFILEAFIDGFVGVGGDIDGIKNPALLVEHNQVVTVTLRAGDSLPHNFVIDGKGGTDVVATLGGYPRESALSFTADADKTLAYYCSILGHYSSMHGSVVLADGSDDSEATMLEPAQRLSVSAVKTPWDIPPPVGARLPQNVTVVLNIQEVIGALDDETSFEYWTYNGTVPGPLIRARVGDTLIVKLVNPSTSKHTHSIDLHAVNADGGGAAATQAAPGTTATLVTVLEWAGVFIYHCASPHIPTHISKGMYGAISVEPAAGLPAVDTEFYVGQNEIYTKAEKGTPGHQIFDEKKQLDERPSYVVFNGRVNALTLDAYKPMAAIGDVVRIFFAVGGPNLAANFHLIGGVWSRVSYETSFDQPNMINSETIVVPPGSALVLEVNFTRTGRFILVDHALSRTFDKGCLGFIDVV
jgi:nitrite reductase (NO-forming)